MNATIMSQDEARLLRRFARAGDPDAFSEITRLYAGMVYGTCLRITGNQEHAADAAQETFFHLLKNAGRITGSLGGWLHQVAVRRAIDLVRRDAARRRHESAFAAAVEAVETDQWTDVSPLVDAAIGELDEDLRDILLRYYLQGQSTVQIAVAKGVSQPTISRRVEQALSLLRGNLQAKGVLVSATVLGGLMPNAATSAPAAVLQELGKMGLTISGTAAGSVATTVFSGLTLKVAGLAVLALLAVGGFLISVHSRRSPMGLLAAAPAQVGPEARWGEAVDGVQARLRALQTNWNAGAIPRLFVDVRNQGTRRLLVQKQIYGCELELDGQWFRRPANTLETRALPSPFPPGRQYDGIVINLDRLWERTVSQDVRRSRRTVPERLRLMAGKHTMRVAVNATADKAEPGEPVRAISNPVVIEVVAARATAVRPLDSLDALVKEIGAANLVQAARQTESRHGQATRQFGGDIAPELWIEALRQLRPERVYLHGVNVVAVLEGVPGKEQGLYICLPESSMMPSNGTDGFTFVRLAAQVYQFERLP